MQNEYSMILLKQDNVAIAKNKNTLKAVSLTSEIKISSKRIVKNIILILEELIAIEENKKTEDKCFTNCSNPRLSKIPLKDFFKKIRECLTPDVTSMISAFILLDRIISTNQIKLNKSNVHELFTTCLLIAVKLNEDIFLDNKYFSFVTGIKLKELNSLERKLCQFIDFKTFIYPKIFTKYYNHIKYYSYSILEMPDRNYNNKTKLRRSYPHDPIGG